jgi:putative transposase
MRYKSTFVTPMFSRGESLAHSVTTLRAILRRVGRIHLDYLTASLFRFALQDQDELTPSHVADALGEMMILHHSSHVQIFDGDCVKLLDEIERCLVVEVRALASNLLMLPGQQFDCLTPAIASLVRTARDFALSSLQFPLGLAQKLRIFDSLTRRQRGEVFNADINSHCVASLREEPGLVLFNRKGHVPTIGLTLNCAGLDRPFNRTGETNPAGADLGEMKFVAFEPESALRIGEGIISRGGLESRIARLVSILDAPKESVERFIHTAQSILKNLAVNLSHVFTDQFDLWKLDGLSVVVDRNAIDLIGVASLLNRGVVEFAAGIERGRTTGHKLRIRLELVFVRLHCPHYILVHMAKQQLRALHHCVFSLHFHLVLVTKYRRKVISNEMKKRLGEIFSNTLSKWECELIEFNGEADHVHLLFSATPKPSLSALVNNLKTVSSRLIRKEFRREISKVYWKPVFWHRSYCLLTCGGAPLSVIQQYIQQQSET